ncbi:hypothetical protein [Shewanella sp. TC10]|uniref:hypothetical protein n=1 Tax=Shewanella sp. TC10 TaxID=1419739 RepID=UPI00129DAB0D|nr:hypothetical protein [Shewanella sp. TC10]
MKSLNITVLSLLILALTILTGCSEQPVNSTQEDLAQVSDTKKTDTNKPMASPNIKCDMTYFSEIERLISSGDGQGHGPDIGSEEWQSVIEFKLGVRGQSEVPPRDTPMWCEYIKSQIETSY